MSGGSPALTGPLGHVGLLVLLLVLLWVLDRRPDAPQPRWVRPVLLDGWARQRLRADSPERAIVARRWSDWGLWTLSVAPYLTALVIGLATEVSGGVAVLAAAQTNALCGAANRLAAALVGRQRPHVADGGDLGSSRPGDSRERYKSFFSGHACLSFGGAAMLMAQGRAWGLPASLGVALAVVSLGMASGTGLLRVVSDRHYLSDVIVGSVVGAAIGTLAPWLLHGMG